MSKVDVVFHISPSQIDDIALIIVFHHSHQKQEYTEFVLLEITSEP